MRKQAATAFMKPHEHIPQIQYLRLEIITSFVKRLVFPKITFALVVFCRPYICEAMVAPMKIYLQTNTLVIRDDWKNVDICALLIEASLTTLKNLTTYSAIQARARLITITGNYILSQKLHQVRHMKIKYQNRAKKVILILTQITNIT